MRSLQFRYDPVAQAVYIYIGDSQWRIARRTVEVGNDEGVMFDLDQNDKVFGIEILNVGEPTVHVYDTDHGRPTHTVKPDDSKL